MISCYCQGEIDIADMSEMRKGGFCASILKHLVNVFFLSISLSFLSSLHFSS